MAKLLMCFSGPRVSSPGPAQYEPVEKSTGRPWDGPEAECSDVAPVRVWEGPIRQAHELECSGSSGTAHFAAILPCTTFFFDCSASITVYMRVARATEKLNFDLYV